MGTMRAIQVLPNILLGILIGIMIDRYNRRNVMILSSLIIILSLAILYFLLVFKMLEIWHIYILGFFIFTFSYTLGNSYDTVIPEIVKDDQLVKANSSLTLVDSTVNLISPILAGMMYMVDLSIGLVITIMGTLIMLFCSSRLKVTKPKKEAKEDVYKKKSSLKVEFLEGWNALVDNRRLFMLTISITIMNIASAASGAVLAFYALYNLEISNQTLGIVYSAAALGGVFAALASNKLKDVLEQDKIFITSVVITAIGFFVNFISTHWTGLAIGLLLISFGTITTNIYYITLRQKTIESHLLGRVSGTSSMIMKLAAPISFISAGALGELIEINYIFLSSSIILLILSVYIYFGFQKKVVKNKGGALFK